MIYLYSGTPGSGKSCHQAEDISEFLTYEHGAIIANYTIDTSRFKGSFKRGAIFLYRDNSEINPAMLRQFSRDYHSKHRFREGNIRLYLDEAQLMFNNREWDAKGRKDWISFFTQHRKYGYDIFLIAQFDRMLDRHIRSLIEYEYKHRRLGNAGIKGKLLSLALGGGTYVAVKIWYPMKEKLGVEIHHIRKRWYSLYDSYKDFGEADEQIPGGDIAHGRAAMSASPAEGAELATDPEIIPDDKGHGRPSEKAPTLSKMSAEGAI